MAGKAVQDVVRYECHAERVGAHDSGGGQTLILGDRSELRGAIRPLADADEHAYSSQKIVERSISMLVELLLYKGGPYVEKHLPVVSVFTTQTTPPRPPPAAIIRPGPMRGPRPSTIAPAGG
jgi:hypothetical protein